MIRRLTLAALTCALLGACDEASSGTSSFTATTADAVATASPADASGADLPDTGPGDTGPGDTTDADAGLDTADPPDTGPPTPVDPASLINAGWIGGACATAADCAYDASACLADADGFPEGHCTQPCDLFCPDQAGAVTTFCVDPLALGLDGLEGTCVARCDFGVSPTGCRPGYVCAPMERHDAPQTVVYACVPQADEVFEPSPCHDALIARGVGFEPVVHVPEHPDTHPQLVCEVVDPVRIDGSLRGVDFRSSTVNGAVNRLFAACPLALALDDTAALLAPQGVTDILHWGIYSCRVIADTDKLSEHGRAAAIDIRGLVLASGAVLDVLDHWEKGVAFPRTDEGSFLRWVADSWIADAIFTTVLTPEYNAAHADHFHCDLSP